MLPAPLSPPSPSNTGDPGLDGCPFPTSTTFIALFPSGAPPPPPGGGFFGNTIAEPAGLEKPRKLASFPVCPVSLSLIFSKLQRMYSLLFKGGTPVLEAILIGAGPSTSKGFPTRQPQERCFFSFLLRGFAASTDLSSWETACLSDERALETPGPLAAVAYFWRTRPRQTRATEDAAGRQQMVLHRGDWNPCHGSWRRSIRAALTLATLDGRCKPHRHVARPERREGHDAQVGGGGWTSVNHPWPLQLLEIIWFDAANSTCSPGTRSLFGLSD